MSRGKRGIFSRVYFNFSQAEMYNGLKSVGTIRYRAYGSCGSGFQPSARLHIPAWDFNPMRKSEMRPFFRDFALVVYQYPGARPLLNKILI